ncbi:MAG: zinc-ribbon domain-containing protein [Kofleriaceae bacterium]|nr:zinc-ribbon domain-containing protein [Kofleriaceae bacterium]
MKFACDRCKTRYSIADERVRGKILKIRCKNCANVITVREGGEAELAAAEPAPATAPSGGARGGGAPLQAAFASAMAGPGGGGGAPPAALEEEWYVSLDGTQHGPLSLAQAQAWIRARPSDADLHCWCEGFDDWLPVDKVSHFRGLRRPPPRPQTAPAATPPPRPPEPEPEPLFAATMAALEADAATRQPRLESPTSAALAPSPLANAGLGGRGAPAPAAARTPLPAPLPSPGGGKAPASSIGGALGLRPAHPAQGTGPAAIAGTPAPAPAPAGNSFGGAEPPTMITAPPPELEAAPEPGPGPVNGNGHGRNGHGATAGAGGFDDLFAGRSKPSPAPAAAIASDDDDDEGDGDLSIGEVSRVVNLADLARQANRPRPAAGRAPTAAVPALRATGAVPSLGTGAGLGATGAMPSLGGGFGATGAMPVPAGMGPPGMMVGGPGAAPAAPVATKHHHVLWVVVAVVLLGLVGVVLLVLNQGGDDTGPRVSVGDDDTLGMQIDDPRRPRIGSGAGTGAGSGSGQPGIKIGTGPIRRPNGSGGGGEQVGVKPTGGDLDSNGQPRTDLRPDEVSDVANKLSMGRQRCYEQALKKDPFLDVKKIAATIKIDRAGVVTDVKLSSHADHTLGVCLIAAIKRWKVRESTTGITTQMSFAFVQ